MEIYAADLNVKMTKIFNNRNLSQKSLKINAKRVRILEMMGLQCNEDEDEDEDEDEEEEEEEEEEEGGGGGGDDDDDNNHHQGLKGHSAANMSPAVSGYLRISFCI
jgi:ABC-type Zn2+ transport system substrate-binding protein/surface adhesin